MKLYRIDDKRASEYALVYHRSPDVHSHTHDSRDTLRRLLDASMLVEVEPVEIRIWFCENRSKAIGWTEKFWPLHCPVCGKAVHEQLSSHHWFLEDVETESGEMDGE